MTISDKQLGDALQIVAEQIHALEVSLVKLQAGLHAVKGTLAIQMNPSAPKQALEQIQDLEDAIVKRDPNAEARKQFSEVIEMLKILDKHGGPKEA
jgi:hypothetical protein